ncbi:hypothetical protein PR048_008571 [Dryococelus australis]|uniref:Uncharacterized protein n=1 Tax=Dryococelus australis TaxID=614101 RepID=A0ABQ9HXG7_9NEOP|nr:hypothetical protein PR048_008571 [Dryococelus australis]
MADGMCVDGTANGGEESLQKVSTNVGSISQKGGRNADGLKAVKPAFYISGDSGQLCSNFRVNGLGVRAASAMLTGSQFSALCANGEDNCRKKRCSDRYDSSESSDR